MDDLQIAWRPLGELIPYARNPRTHSDAQVAQIAASIREFGWTNPCWSTARTASSRATPGYWRQESSPWIAYR
jgi:hypothetical protein